MEWKSRRRDVPERLEPSLSSGALAEEEGLDHFELWIVRILSLYLLSQDRDNSTLFLISTNLMTFPYKGIICL